MGIIGRDEILGPAVAALRDRNSLLLYGPSGMGKTTLLDRLSDTASRWGFRVLRAAPAHVESQLPHLVLIDLFAELVPEAHGMPAQLRQALTGVLLRGSRAANPPDELTVRVAVLDLLRRACEERPVLLVIDDVQWVDEASREVLAFVARRLGDTAMRVLAAERVDGHDPTRLALCPEPVTAIEVTPLAPGDIAALLDTVVDGPLSSRVVRRIADASGGNPLYALELGRQLDRDEGEPAEFDPLPVSRRLRTLMAGRLAGLDEPTRWAMLLAALVARPSLDLLAACDALPADDLESAETAGIITVTGDGGIAFTHPLLRELVNADATTASRRKAHSVLAAAVDEPVARAVHLALGSPVADEEIAALAADAAEVAAHRGAPGSAADLAQLAVRRTPPCETDAAAARSLAAARYAQTAGRVPEATESARSALESGAASVRVEARLLLIDLAGQDLAEADAHLVAARVDAAGDTALQAKVALYTGTIDYFERRYDHAAVEVSRAEELAHEVGDVDLAIQALNLRACLPASEQSGEADKQREAAFRLAEGRPVSASTIEARQMWAMNALFRGDTTVAVRGISRLEADVRDHGRIGDLMSVLLSSSSIHVRSGDGPAGLRAGRECARLFEDAGAPGPGLVSAAQAEWCAGTPERALEAAARAIAVSQAVNDDEWLEVGFAYQGQALLLAGDVAAAAEAFNRAARLQTLSQHGDPAIIPWNADHATALVAAGDLDAAATVLDDLTARACRFERLVVLLGAARARALYLAARGEPARAAEGLADALREYSARSYPIDVARAELTLGRLHRRMRHRSKARRAFARAVELTTAIGAAPWLALARGELARLDSGAAPARDLSDAEQRIVDLVAEGATNRDIGTALFLSVKAVEARLSRLYRRFGVRNRAGLLSKLGERGGGHASGSD
ncbi:AAA family ATPase [Stackebrandtia nassauensis]|uniref:Transcriptional regulator, LuxR family n=1 Tax=Stackebrandtia nassauensis (strain DSM 44728 / CIP 108903 / NRRL B-16338 / NBRC 102104 / LLR-40K-21) TaxID=446470 RepID=D3Q9W0_STANL|nr:LuxR family transcriptional regulator [Stackebrandtia nassauensis]ADD44656.1 transcriptional regulator, LuxR family [Stackebrandtia nassauensis DSM 44728]